LPHLTIEYSANVADRVAIQRLVDEIHDEAIATGIVPVSGLRTRAVRCEHFAVADRHEDNGFIAVLARLSRGRSAEDRARFLASIDAAIHRTLGEHVRGLAISVQIAEIDPETRLNSNHIRERMQNEQAAR
jgi:5-carboxymethyl-2-hydroxymuconate isomerase